MQKNTMRKHDEKQKVLMRRLLTGSFCILMVLLSIYFIKLGRSLQTGVGEERETPTKPVTKPPVTGTAAATQTPEPTKEPELEIALEHKYMHMGGAKEEVVLGTRLSYAFSYPVYEEEKASAAAKSAAEKLLAACREELEKKTDAKCRLWIDYEDGTYRALTSVVFHITKEVDGEKTESVFEWLFNGKKGEAYGEADQLFHEPAYAYVSGKIAEEAKTADTEQSTGGTQSTGEEQNAEETAAVDHLYYLITEEGAKFFYRAGGETNSITVPYVELHTYMAVTVNGTERMDNIRELDPEKPMIALTYDDGPHYINTKRLLQILEENNARATFFELGDRLTWSGSEECAKMVYAAGHELASHTWSHKNLTGLSVEELQKEFSRTREKIYEYTGEYPTYVRAPGGTVNDTVKEYAFAPLINWSIDSRDWESRDRDKIIEQIKKDLKKNRIILMHDIHTCTIDASEILIPWLIEQGYQLVTLSELFYYNGVEPENGVLYHGSDY